MKSAEATRLYFFVGTLLACVAGEFLFPRRLASAPRLWRWAMNFGLMLLDTVALRLALPVLALDMARLAEERGLGLLNRVAWPFPAKLLIAFLCLDLVIYAQHWAFHSVPLLWRMHRVHHTDVDIDATSGVRFHPLEILVSMGIKLAAIALTGAHFFAVLAFEIVLNATSLFNHSNLRIPERLERVLRLFLVTPDVHRIHHSVRTPETNSNFCFNFPWWDRLFGTYESEPRDGQAMMPLGLPEHRSWREQGLPWLLALPFRRAR